MRVTTRREKIKISAMPGVEASTVQMVIVIICMQREEKKKEKANDKKETQQDTRADETKGKGNSSDCR